MTVDWKNIFKIRLSNKIDSSMDKHDIVKLLLVRKILNKHKSNKNWIRIYTEFTALGEKKADVYYEDLKSKEAYVYEIQKDTSAKWLKEITEYYKDWKPSYVDSFDLVIVDLNKLSDDINELSEQVEEYVL